MFFPETFLRWFSIIKQYPNGHKISYHTTNLIRLLLVGYIFCRLEYQIDEPNSHQFLFFIGIFILVDGFFSTMVQCVFPIDYWNDNKPKKKK